MSVVVIGAGQAGLQTIMSLRQGGYEGDITLIGDEAYLPYQRPPLSKAYLSGKMQRERLFLKPEDFYSDNNVTLKLETSVERLDAAAKTVELNNGETLAYEHAVIATGSRPRLLDVPGRDLQNIFDLRGMADIDAMQPHFESGKKLVVVGGGYIGLGSSGGCRRYGHAGACAGSRTALAGARCRAGNFSLLHAPAQRPRRDFSDRKPNDRLCRRRRGERR